MADVTTGRIVHYRLSANDVHRIEHRRRLAIALMGTKTSGTMLGEGNTPQVGDLVPLLVVRVWPGEHDTSRQVFVPSSCANCAEAGEVEAVIPKSSAGVNGQAFLDGNDSLWVTSAPQGDWAGAWDWPEFKPEAQLSALSGGSH